MRNVYADAVTRQPNLSVQNAPSVSARLLPASQPIGTEDIEGSQRVLQALFGQNGMFPGLGVSSFSASPPVNSANSGMNTGFLTGNSINTSGVNSVTQRLLAGDFSSLTQGQTINSFNQNLTTENVSGITLGPGSSVLLPGAPQSTNELLATVGLISKVFTENPVT